MASALSLLAALPLLRQISAGPVPSLRQSAEAIDNRGIATFAADGWMSSGLTIAWPLVLFAAMGSRYEAIGVANALAGLAGAVAGVACGRAIDQGRRDQFLAAVSLARVLGFVVRAGAGWSPLAAGIANATGAAVMGLYAPVLLSVIYDRAKRSGAAYRFHVAAEAGWDGGAVAGCLAAAVASVAPVPSLAVLPAVLGVGGAYLCVRGAVRSGGRFLDLPIGEAVRA